MLLTEYQKRMVAYAILLTSGSELVKLLFPNSSPLSALGTRTHGTFSEIV
jgi:hypothetical protein